MKYLKLFDSHEDYTDFQPDMLKPNVSYCQLEDEVHFNGFRDARIVARFNVTSTSEPTKIMDADTDPSDVFSSIEIDGVEMATMDYEYTFGTTGEHIIKYTLIDTTTVPNKLFFECEDMTNVAFPDTVTKIGNHAFRGAGVESVNLPQSLTRIGESSFFGCANLKRIIIPDSVTLLGRKLSYGTMKEG